MDERVQSFREALEALDRLRAQAIFQQVLQGSSPMAAVGQLVVPALEQLGAAWQEGTVALSQVYMSGRFCEELVEQVLPACDPDRKNQPRTAIVVLSDYHMLGQRIVYSVMRASGFELFNYGRMDVGELVERTVADHLRVLLISALILPSALKVRQVCDGLKARGGQVRVAVGGAPFLFDDRLWREVGADAMGRSASDAVAIVQRWTGELS